MLFDQPGFRSEYDPQNMHDQIIELPSQLKTAWETGMVHPLPQSPSIRQVVLAGMGGSAIGADLLRAYAAPLAGVPVLLLRDYDLPAWAQGEETLVVASSHSGNTEETLSAYSQAVAHGCSRIAVCTGGKLAALASEHGDPLWRFEHAGQPRAAVGYSFGMLLALFHRLGLVPDPAQEVQGAVAAMQAQAADLAADVPAFRNPAKRYAGQLMGRWFTVFGAEFLAPVARRWKTQVNELAKAWAQFETLPEADHNALVGTENPETAAAGSFTMFLVSERYHQRNQLRMDLTRKAYMLEGVSTDFYLAHGDGRLAHQWTTLHFGDFVSYYLAISYQIDPTPVEGLEAFKAEMNQFS